MKTLGCVLCICILSGCAPDALTVVYNAKVAESKSDCISKGGDEFLPYGAVAWLATLMIGGKPSLFKCVRFEKTGSTTVAVYSFHQDGADGVSVVTR